MLVKTSELIGAALDWAVALSMFVGTPPIRVISCYLYTIEGDNWNPSSDWSQGGPIIEREWLDVTPWPNESEEGMRWCCDYHDAASLCRQYGPTPLIAAMRCFVASKLGDEVEIPEELPK